jgi:tetratricopeptide (TPR) repeat protein
VLAAPLPMPRLALETEDGRRAALFAPTPEGPRTTGRPLLIAPWASWCAPCVAELRALAARAEELRARGVDVLALAVDAPEERADEWALLEEIAWPFSRGALTAESIDVLDAIHGGVLDRESRMPLPTSFLVDPEGRLVALYVGGVDPERLLADLELTGELAPEARRAAATPFAGRWYGPPPAPDLFKFEARFERRGLADATRSYRLMRLQVVRASPASLLWEFGRRSGERGRLEEAARLFREALALDPARGAVWVDLGIVLAMAGNPEEAAAAFQEALALAPDDADTRLRLGLALLALGDVEGARAELALLVERAPDRARELRDRIESFRKR